MHYCSADAQTTKTQSFPLLLALETREMTTPLSYHLQQQAATTPHDSRAETHFKRWQKKAKYSWQSSHHTSPSSDMPVLEAHHKCHLQQRALQKKNEV